MQDEIVPASAPEVFEHATALKAGLQAPGAVVGYLAPGAPANVVPAGCQLRYWGRLPHELRQRAQWLLAGPNEKNELKVPLTVGADGRVYPGSSTNAATWLQFEDAVTWATEYGYGIGYVISADDPFVCVDLDVKDAQNEPDHPERWTTPEQFQRFQSIALVLSSYTEFSRSGKGVHIWCRAKVGPGLKRDGIEIYSQERFIACTGNVLYDLPIVNQQTMIDQMATQMRVESPRAELEELEPTEHDDVIWQRARAASNAHKFNALCAGHWTEFGYPSQSEADTALMSMFTFYSRSNEQCRRMFRQTVLGAREKAQKDDRYLDRTLGLIRGRMAKEAAELAQVRRAERQKFEAIGQGVPIDPASLVAPNMSLELMEEALVFISDGSFVAFRDNPLVMRQRADFKNLLRPCKTEYSTLTEKGEKKVVKETFELWLDSKDKRRTVHTVTFHPGQPEFCADPRGIAALNLYRPRPHVAPANWQQRVQPFLEHAHFLVPIAEEREKFLDWLAHIEQHPGVLPHHGYLMVAPVEGIGRNTLADMLACVWAGHVALSLDLGSVLSDKFTDELARKFLAVVDEINEGYQSGMWPLAEKLKSFITASVRNMNPKFGRKYTEVNCCRVLIFSNHESALPLKATDRRLNVIRNPNAPRPPEYYAWLRTALSDPLFIASVREWLRQRDISRFNPGARAVLNEAKQAVIEATRSEATDRALELAAAWPRDCITGNEFCFELYGTDTPKDSAKLKHRADEAQIVKWKGNGGGRIHLHGRQVTVWILRNHDRWAQASSEAIKQELSRAV